LDAHDVLVVEDEASLRASLQRALGLEGFRVRVAASGWEALRVVASRPPDVVVLDLGLPDLDGVRVIHHLRDDGVEVPICVLSARHEVEDRVAGLQAGADDYLVKPFHLAELVARLQALLRRRTEPGDVPIRVGALRVDPARRSAHRGDRELALTRREFDLLVAFARHPGIVLSRAQLLGHVWGYDFEVESNVVDVFVGYLRRKLEADGEPRLLQTVRGVGFVLRADP